MEAATEGSDSRLRPISMDCYCEHFGPIRSAIISGRVSLTLEELDKATVTKCSDTWSILENRKVGYDQRSGSPRVPARPLLDRAIVHRGQDDFCSSAQESFQQQQSSWSTPPRLPRPSTSLASSESSLGIALLPWRLCSTSPRLPCSSPLQNFYTAEVQFAGGGTREGTLVMLAQGMCSVSSR